MAEYQGERKQVILRMKPSDISALDSIAAARGISRSELMISAAVALIDASDYQVAGGQPTAEDLE